MEMFYSLSYEMSSALVRQWRYGEIMACKCGSGIVARYFLRTY